MILDWLELQSYRSYESINWIPDPGLNVLIGRNGAGKTNILEAIAYLSALKSFRGAPDGALIRSGAEAAAALLAAGADVNQRDENGETALHLTKGVYNPSADTLKLLIEAGADVNAKNPSGSTPLHQAIAYGIQEGEPEHAEVLIAAGAEVDAKDGQGAVAGARGAE